MSLWQLFRSRIDSQLSHRQHFVCHGLYMYLIRSCTQSHFYYSGSEESFQTPLETPTSAPSTGFDRDYVLYTNHQHHPAVATLVMEQQQPSKQQQYSQTSPPSSRPRLVLTPPDLNEAFTIEDSIHCWQRKKDTSSIMLTTLYAAYTLFPNCFVRTNKFQLPLLLIAFSHFNVSRLFFKLWKTCCCTLLLQILVRSLDEINKKTYLYGAVRCDIDTDTTKLLKPISRPRHLWWSDELQHALLSSSLRDLNNKRQTALEKPRRTLEIGIVQ